jgi:hypothetical protein
MGSFGFGTRIALSVHFRGSFGEFGTLVFLLLCSYPTKQGIQRDGYKVCETLHTKKDGFISGSGGGRVTVVSFWVLLGFGFCFFSTERERESERGVGGRESFEMK